MDEANLKTLVLDFTREAFRTGKKVRFSTAGWSMFPFIQNKDKIETVSCAGQKFRIGDVIIYRSQDGSETIVAHRLVRSIRQKDGIIFITKGDSLPNYDKAVPEKDVLGRVVKIAKKYFSISLDSFWGRAINLFMLSLSLTQVISTARFFYNRLKNSGTIIVLFCFFSLLRLYHLGYHDFWFDELGTVFYVYSPSSFSIKLPFFYEYLMHLWAIFFRLSEFSLRFPSFLFSFFSIILTYKLGKHLFNKKVGILASILIGLSPFHLWYAQEARCYSMLLFFGTASSYLLLKAIEKDQFILWFSFILTSISGFYTNYFYIYLFIAHFLVLLFIKRSRLGFKETICFLIVLVCFFPYLPTFLGRFHKVGQGFWVLKPDGRSLLITMENFILGYNGTSVLYKISNILTGLFFILALCALRKQNLRRPFLLIAFLFCIPIMSVFIFSRMFFSIYLDRALILFSPYFYLLLSLGIASLARNLRIFLLSVLVTIMFIGDYRFINDLMTTPFVHHVGAYTKKPVKPAAKFLKDHVNLKEDVVVFTNESSERGIAYYADFPDSFEFRYFFDPKLPDTNWKRPRVENNYSVSFNTIGHLKFKRLWVIASDWPISGHLDPNSLSSKAWLDQHFNLEFSKESNGLWIFRYGGHEPLKKNPAAESL